MRDYENHNPFFYFDFDTKYLISSQSVIVYLEFRSSFLFFPCAFFCAWEKLFFRSIFAKCHFCLFSVLILEWSHLQNFLLLKNTFKDPNDVNLCVQEKNGYKSICLQNLIAFNKIKCPAFMDTKDYKIHWNKQTAQVHHVDGEFEALHLRSQVSAKKNRTQVSGISFSYI